MCEQTCSVVLDVPGFFCQGLCWFHWHGIHMRGCFQKWKCGQSVVDDLSFGCYLSGIIMFWCLIWFGGYWLAGMVLIEWGSWSMKRRLLWLCQYNSYKRGPSTELWGTPLGNRSSRGDDTFYIDDLRVSKFQRIVSVQVRYQHFNITSYQYMTPMKQHIIIICGHSQRFLFQELTMFLCFIFGIFCNCHFFSARY